MESKFLKIVKEKSGADGVKILSAATVAGILQSLVVVIINAAADQLPEAGLNFRYFMLFMICIIGFLGMKHYTLARTVNMVQDLIFDIRVRIVDKIRKSGLIEIEEMGKSQIYTTLAENADRIFEAAKRCADASASIVMVVFSFLYIFILSPVAFAFSIFLIAVGISIYLFNQKTTDRDLRNSIKKETEFFDSIDHLLDGFKEVKINSDKSDDLFENDIKENSTVAKALKMKTEFQFIHNYLFSQTFFYILMACIIFVLPQITNLVPEVIISVMAVILFMIGPLGSIVEAMPLISKADVAVEAIDALEAYLDAANDVEETSPRNHFQPQEGFDTIRFNSTTFSYCDEKGSQFTLGPIDLDLRSGEILFIVGGNGSGKSTLLKLITGLYYPLSGRILCNGIPIDRRNTFHYRNLFSIIFTDFHLFKRLYGIKEVDEDGILDLLKTMQISDKTDFDKGRFTNINLSTGQKKRLALIISYIEDKPILAFDEVAADQDPEFRKYFYEVLLMDLKKKGKTIVAVSHDDRFFHIGDRILKMEYGKFTKE
jgi:cyclic peptide transporter